MDLQNFKQILLDKIYELLKNNLPYREPYRYTYKKGSVNTKTGKVVNKKTVVRLGGPVGKPGTPFYSPYPGNLKNNGVYRTNNAIVLNVNKVGYIPYANKTANWHTKNGTNGGPDFIQRTNEDVVAHLRSIGCKVTRK